METLPSEVLFYIFHEVDDISLCFRSLLQTNRRLFGRLLGNHTFWYRQWLLCFSTELGTSERTSCRRFISEKDSKEKRDLLHKSSGSATNAITPEISDWFWLFRARAMLTHAWVKRRFQTQIFDKPSNSRVFLVDNNPDLLGILSPRLSLLTIQSLRDEKKYCVELPPRIEEVCFLVSDGSWVLTDIRSRKNREATAVDRVINVVSLKTSASCNIRLNPQQVENGFLAFREPMLILEKSSDSIPECAIVDVRNRAYPPLTIGIEPQAIGVLEEKSGTEENKVQLESYAIEEALLHPQLPIVMVIASGQVHFYMYHGEIGARKHATLLLNIDLNSQVTDHYWNKFELPAVIWQKQPDRQSGYIDDSCAIITWLVHPLDPFVTSTNSGVYCMKISIDSRRGTDIKCQTCGEHHRIPKLQVDWRTRFVVKLWTELNDERRYDKNQIFSFNPRNLLSIGIRTQSKFVFLMLTLSSGKFCRSAEVEVLSKYSKYHVAKFPNIKPMLSILNKQLCQVEFLCCETGCLVNSWSFRDNTKSPRKLKRHTRHINVANVSEEAFIVSPQLHYLFFGENVHRRIMR
ncbi:hypothetical protein K493DRAFT_305608 [Basidiobolus meristosporus CBS 931.73]|uniref:F-box domain-containing protein n=1 Tax=Basidiobolus meristosporus CBS 931.73 TaxID=1314790 RepID=A0A1Y1XV46_9FUNG|nr:hypothetical protein K493DRAFT_305608 [Basidiobolus meristosporus CBS 931.73]|eukprot:ORX89628.1 hypothetical protein K493DRAFT_305608 [Basidiobolus meristosporus CBS 931.73]